MLIQSHLPDIKFNIDAIKEQVLSLPWATDPNSEWAYAVNHSPDKTDNMFHSGANINVNDPFVLNDEFVGTPVGEALAALGPIGSAHFRKLQKGECYGAHTDVDNRIHLAVITNPYAKLVDFESNTMHHVPADGQWYYMDTSIPHDGINFSFEPRIHLHVNCLIPAATGPGAYLTIKPTDNPETEKFQPWIGQMFLGYLNRSLISGALTGWTQLGMRHYRYGFTDSTAFDAICKHIQDNGYGIEVEPIS